MVKPNLIEEIEKRTIFRKKAKNTIDSVITLESVNHDKKKLSVTGQETDSGYVRLLDEGAIVYGDGTIRDYIKKGTLKAYYDSLPDDFTGTINYGHIDFSVDPVFIGQWTKADLRLVDIEDGRKALDVKLQLDSDSLKVQEMERSAEKYGYSIGISSEFYFNIDDELSDQMGFCVIDQVDIFSFAVVGEAGNVNSSNIQLKEENNMGLFDKKNLEEQNKELAAQIETLSAELKALKAQEPEETVDKELLALSEGMANQMVSLTDEVKELKAQREKEKTEAKEALERLSALSKKIELSVDGQVEKTKQPKDNLQWGE